MVHYKACLVTKGYVQLVVIDYDKVFTLVARIESLRILLPLVM